MELMEKKYEENGAAGVRDLQRWPMDSDAVEFLAVTTSASSVDELIKVRLTVIFSQCLTAYNPAATTHSETSEFQGNANRHCSICSGYYDNLLLLSIIAASLDGSRAT
jgi:hypothetical protein